MADPRPFAGKASFVVGPEKTATTFIQMLLDLNPAVSTPQGIKETFFFENFYSNGIEWYFDRFAKGRATGHLVEVAPGCFGDVTALERIRDCFPNARIVICARDPVERTLSHYNHLRRYGYLNTGLEDSLDPDERPLKASFYSRYCPMWERAFGAENVIVLDMNVLERDPAGFAREVYRAVGVPPVTVPADLLTSRANEAAEPGNYLVARLATFVSNEFKRRGLYGPLALLRRTPIHGLVYGRRKPDYDASADMAVRASLMRLLAGEYDFLERHYGILFGPHGPGAAPSGPGVARKAS